MFTFMIDFHQNILSAQCSFRCVGSDEVSKIILIVRNDCIEVLLYDNVLLHQLTILTPPDFFVPTTFSSMEKPAFVNINENDCSVLSEYETKQNVSKKISSIEASFRLQISCDSFIKEISSNSIKLITCKDYLKSVIKPCVPCIFTCTKCEKSLNKEQIEFKSVEYYSKNSELSEAWFCHSHVVAKSQQLNINVCYISDIFMYVHENIIQSLDLKKDDKNYLCGHCFNVLSSSKETNASFIGFFCDEIMLGTSDDKSFSSADYKKDVSLIILRTLIDNNLQYSFSTKLCLYSEKVPDKKCVLIWITSQKVAQFLLEAPTDKIPSEVHLKTKEMYKVLYCISSFDSEVAKSWKRDCQVDYVTVSQNMLQFVVEILGSSSKYFSKPETGHADFNLGYLPA